MGRFSFWKKVSLMLGSHQQLLFSQFIAGKAGDRVEKKCRERKELHECTAVIVTPKPALGELSLRCAFLVSLRWRCATGLRQDGNIC